MTPPGSGVAALVVTRGMTPTLPTTLDALAQQTLSPDHVVVVDAGGPPLTASDCPPGALLVAVAGARTLGDAVHAASSTPEAGPVLASVRRWWILHDDSAPEPTCLARLWEVADRGRTIAVVGPKQVSWDASQLLEVGISATRSARRLDAVMPGEIDQGQYDGASDVLAVGTAGMLVERSVWEDLGGTDPALGPFGDGLEFSRRVRRAGHRIVVVPGARVRHARTSLISPTGDDDEGVSGDGVEADSADSSFRARRFAQLYTWTVAVPWWQWPFLALWLAVWSPARALGRILTGRAHLAGDEIGAWLRVVASTPALVRSRRRGARSATLPRSALVPLEARPGDLVAGRRTARRLHEAGDTSPVDPLVRSSLARHVSSSRAWFLGVLAGLVLAALVPGARLLGNTTGAAWGAAPSTFGALWRAAWSAWLPGGDGSVGPGDPVVVPLALVSAPFAPLGVAPTTVWTWLLVLAIPLAGLAAWPLAAHLTTSLPARAAASLTWAVLPALTVSVLQGRLAASLVHVLLPVVALGWLRVTGEAAPLVVDGARGPTSLPAPRHRGAGWAALALAVVVSSTPWMLGAAALVVLLTLAWTRRRAAVLAATLVPSGLLVAPFVARAARTGRWEALLTPGGPALATRTDRSWMLLLGMPAGTGWTWVACFGAVVAALVLAALLGLWHAPGRAGAPAALGVLGLAAAFALTRVEVSATGTVATAWPAPALSLSALGFLLAALVATASTRAWDDTALRVWRIPALTLSLLALVGAGTLSAARFVADADRPFDRVTTATTPAVAAVSVQAQSSTRAGRVLVLGGGGGSITVSVLRGDGTLVTDASAITRAQHLDDLRGGSSDVATADLAARALALVTSPDAATVTAIAAHGIDTVLLPNASAPGASDLVEALDRAPGVEKVGDTDAGELWRIRPDGGLPARVRLVNGDTWGVIPSTQLTATATLPAGSTGTLVLAERADPGWHATLGGTELKAVDPVDGWAQGFGLSGSGTLRLTYRPWWVWPWRALAGLGLLGAALATIPLRRRT